MYLLHAIKSTIYLFIYLFQFSTFYHTIHRELLNYLNVSHSIFFQSIEQKPKIIVSYIKLTFNVVIDMNTQTHWQQINKLLNQYICERKWVQRWANGIVWNFLNEHSIDIDCFDYNWIRELIVTLIYWNRMTTFFIPFMEVNSLEICFQYIHSFFEYY